ncbi:MAG: hypothetical protein Q9165_008628 [Trypethelium subeluteriae]
MPLHLLGKKSWNVYNAENIARVRRDEAEAQALEEERERRMQEIDAERRLAILRGNTPPPLPDDDKSNEVSREQKKRDRHDVGKEDYRKRRRLRGENDTDRDIRLAMEDREIVERAREGQGEGGHAKRKAARDAPLIDHAGHIDLFPQEKAPRKPKEREKNIEAEKEAEKKKREFEDQYTMRFSNAAGNKQGIEKPWYSSNGTQASTQSFEDEIGKDVWGNEDPRRNERVKSRIKSSDPMAFMRKAQTQLKESERDKRKFEEERQTELEDLKRRERHRSRREGRVQEGDDLEGFSLDAAPEKEHRSQHRRSHRRHGSKDREHYDRTRHESSRRN